MKTWNRIAALLLTGVMLCLFAACSGEFNYETSDLSPYLTLSRDKYMDRTVEITFPDEITDDSVDAYIRTYVLLKNDVAVYLTDRTVQSGDTIGLYYRVVEIDENGGVRDLLTNITGDSILEYKVGENSLKFGKEFDDTLVGMPMHSTLTKKTSGKVAANDVIYLTYSYTYPYVKADGTTDYKSVIHNITNRVDLTKPEETAVFGDWFAAEMKDKVIGTEFKFRKTFDIDGDGKADNVDYNMTIKAATQEAPASFTQTYAADADVADALKGKTVRFDVCINGRLGTAKELLTEKFLTEKLAYKPENEEDKNDIVSAYIRDIKDALITDRNNRIESAAVNALWEILKTEATLKKLPENMVDSYYDGLIQQAGNAYQQYNSQINASSLNEFVKTYYGVGTDDKDFDYKTYFRGVAEDEVKTRLMFYTIFRREGLNVSDADIKAAYSGVVQNMIYNQTMNYYQQTGQLVTITEADIVSNYGQSYINANVRESVQTEKLQTFLYGHITVNAAKAENQ